ncbi:MAG: hypothetical protein E4G97_07385 [Deltaproteobacteria bacterium]|nr:MAG: hypothetical protein E4G97_07385 [Deltaproteobacteria bacterium]
MGDNRGRPYSTVGRAKGMLRIATAITLTGTSASGAVAGAIVAVPFNCRIIGCDIYYSTGGTAEPVVVTIESLLAGTGEAASFGTLGIGTQADGYAASMSLTETEVLAGDVLRLYYTGGTVDSTPVIGSAVVTFMESFVTE